MTLSSAISKAEMTQASQVYQLSRQWHKRGIRTEFTFDDKLAVDWQVYYPETFIGYGGIE